MLIVMETESSQRSQLAFLALTTDKLLKTTGRIEQQSPNIEALTPLFDCPEAVNDIFCNSSLYTLARRDTNVPWTRTFTSAEEIMAQHSAKLHCLYGIPVQVLDEPDDEDLLSLIHI